MNILIILTLLCKNNNENTMYSIADTQIINIKMMECYKYHIHHFLSSNYITSFFHYIRNEYN